MVRVESAKVSSAGNYTCEPYNRVGAALEVEGDDDKTEDTISFEVHGAPSFIKDLPPYTGTTLNAIV